MSVRLEAGKWYRDRTGKVWGPLTLNPSGKPFVAITDEGVYGWYEDGRFRREGGFYALDLIAEVPAAPAQPEGWREALAEIDALIRRDRERDVSQDYRSGRLDGLETAQAIIARLCEPPAPPAPVEREVRLSASFDAGNALRAIGGIFYSDATHRLTLRWTEPPGAPRGAVTGEWERIGGESHDD